ncbi:cytochrome P450 [Pseudogemmobacter sp. W21_MBD1_M6]|uniref:cytochrome P450 n=1 Tax=Pseudogemmobacter sp. W21_MBD1_M6 TaxID=3240271 RepID=UPI003F9DB646
MTHAAPIEANITIDQLIVDPYAVYKRLRAEAPVARVPVVNRTLLTKATDTKYVKDNPVLFSSDDPHTPMERAFRAHTLMRKDGEEHMRERMAMAPAFGAKVIRDVWAPLYQGFAEDYVGRLPRGETVDLFSDLAGPFAARCLAHLLGLPDASDADMQRWSQMLIDGSGNFAWNPDLFAETDEANDEMDAAITAMLDRHRAEQGPSALAVMINSDDPIPMSQIISNIKIAIGGGINEPRDAASTLVFGLLTNLDQRDAVLSGDISWTEAFEEAVRWVAPIQASSRLVTEDTEIRGVAIPKGDVVMTIQASANHDEDVYENGHLFNVFRDKAPHQAFGNGPHFCQGTHVARRMVSQILMPVLFDRFAQMSLPDPGLVTFRGFGFRGPTTLPVTLV